MSLHLNYLTSEEILTLADKRAIELRKKPRQVVVKQHQELIIRSECRSSAPSSLILAVAITIDGERRAYHTLRVNWWVSLSINSTHKNKLEGAAA